MKVLGIDPGFGRMGWAIVEGNRSRQNLVECGCLETSPTDSLNVRLEEIFDQISELVDKHHPDAAAVEELYFFKNAKTVMGVGQARGVILVALVKKKVAAFNYTPLQIKRCIAGYGQADKKQMQMMVKSQLKLKAVPKSDDAADAMAAALTHFFINSQLRTRST